MSAFHYKGEFIKGDNDKGKVYYSYCPDYINCEDVCGRFKIDLVDGWKPIITLRPVVDRNDRRCVEALTYKIKKYFDETKEFPQTVFFTA